MKNLRVPLLLLIVAGCIDEYEIGLPSAPRRIVVDAVISNKAGDSRITIGWSDVAGARCFEYGYPVPCAPVIQNGPYKIDGFVRVIEQETATTVELPFRMNDKTGYVTITPDMQGTPGFTYTLEISFDYNGQPESYVATSIMLPTPPITEITYEIRKGDVGKSDNMVPLISFRDPEGKNFYLFQLCTLTGQIISCGHSRVWSYSLISDTLLPTDVRGLSIDDGASIAKYAEFYPTPGPDSGALVRMYAVDQITYEYYRSLIEQFSNDGGAYAPTPATPKGNISGSGLGLFRAVDESTATVYF